MTIIKQEMEIFKSDMYSANTHNINIIHINTPIQKQYKTKKYSILVLFTNLKKKVEIKYFLREPKQQNLVNHQQVYLMFHLRRCNLYYFKTI